MKLSWVKKLLPKNFKNKFFVFVCFLSLLGTLAAYIPPQARAADNPTNEISIINNNLKAKKDEFNSASDSNKKSKADEVVKLARDRRDKIQKLLYTKPSEVASLIIDNADDYPDEAKQYIEKKVEKKGFIGVIHEDLTNGSVREITKLYGDSKFSGVGDTLISESGKVSASPKSEATISGFAFDNAVLFDPAASSIATAVGYKGPVVGTRTMGVYYVGFLNNGHLNLSRSMISTAVNGTLNSFVNTSSSGQVSIVGNVYDPNLFNINATVPLDDLGKCDMGKITDLTKGLLVANNIDWTIYTDNLIVVDPGFTCGFGGVALLGTSWMMTNGLVALSHEFGHNIGLQHASVYDCGDVVVKAGCPYDPDNTDQEYGNFSDIMGSNHAPVVSSLDYGGYAKDYLGWLDSSTEIANGSQSGTYTIYNIEQHAPFPVANPYRVLKVPTFAGGPDYYIQYHTKYQGLSGPTIELASGQLLDYRHTWLLDLTPGSNNTSLVSDFTDGYFHDGQEFFDPFNNIRIKQLSHDGNSATLQLTRGAPSGNSDSLQVVWSRPSGYSLAKAKKQDVLWPGQTYVVSRRCTSTYFGCPTDFAVVWTGTDTSMNLDLTPGFSYEYKVEIYTKRDGDENHADVYPWVDPTAISIPSCSGGATTCSSSISWNGVIYEAQLLKQRSAPGDPEIKACAFAAGCQDDVNLLSDANVSFHGLLAIDPTTQLESKILVRDNTGASHLLTRVLNLGTADDYSASCTSSDTSCEIKNPAGIGPFVGGEPLDHTVQKDNANGNVLYGSDRVYASSSGGYWSGWGWTYAVVIFPDPNGTGNCYTAGDQCQIQWIYNTNLSNFYITFNGLSPSTKYHWVVCAYTCNPSSGDSKVAEDFKTTNAVGGTFFVNDPLANLEAQSVLPYTGEYFDNMDFTAQKLTRGESAVKFNWGLGSPDPAIASSSYSARWSGNFGFTNTVYRFTASSDSGVRVYLDNYKVMDVTTGLGLNALSVKPGVHFVKIEYIHNTGKSNVRAKFVPAYTCFDINGDGVVNSSDLGLMAANYGLRGISAYDINGDRVVNSADLGLLAKNYNQRC